MGSEQEWQAIDEARRVLGLGRDASLADIGRAYRERARAAHPDLFPPEQHAWCHEQMTALNHAYTVLREYCAGFRFPLDAENVRRELARRDPRAYWEEHFAHGY